MRYFEKYPKSTLLAINLLLLAIVYLLISCKCFNNALTEYQPKSLKKILLEKYVGYLIDHNVGRFIKLREYRPNQILWERPSEDYMTHIAPNSIERKYYRVATDQQGFIGPSDIHVVPDHRIVFLGGSTTECLYVEEDKRFPYVVGRQLEAKSSLKINTYNGGVSANESMHSLNILLNKVIPMKPSIVVLMHNINDLVALRAEGTYWYSRSRKSHVQTSRELFTRYEFSPKQTAIEHTDEQLMTLFRRNLEMFIAICHIQHIRPVLMTQANRVDWFDTLYHRFNDIIRETAKAHDILLIDLANQIPRTEAFLYDHYHYTEKGSLLAAEIIVQALLPI